MLCVHLLAANALLGSLLVEPGYIDLSSLASSRLLDPVEYFPLSVYIQNV